MWFGDIDLHLRYPTTPPAGGIAPRRMQAAHQRCIARKRQQVAGELRALREAMRGGAAVLRWFSSLKAFLQQRFWRRGGGPRLYPR